MRTTLDIEDDVLQAVKELARRERRTAGHILSSLARRALAAPTSRAKARLATRGGVPLVASRGEVVTVARVRELMDQEAV